jgi:hypothetical protein
MRAFLQGLLVLVTASATAAGPASNAWPEVRTGIYVVPSSVERFGSTVHFAIAYGAPKNWVIQWHWAHCQRDWISDITALALPSTGESVQEAYALTLNQRDPFFTTPVEFQPYASFRLVNQSALRRYLAARCKGDAQSQDALELPIAGPERKVGRETFADFLLLRTATRRGELAEGWIRRRPILREELKGPKGDVLKQENGEPFIRDGFTGQDSLARFKITANCSQRQIATSRYTEYDKDGTVVSPATDSGKLKFSEPIPGTIGEAHLEVLCRL